MSKKAYVARIDENILENFKTLTRENGWKQTNEAIELLMQQVISGKIIIKKEKKDVESIEFFFEK